MAYGNRRAALQRRTTFGGGYGGGGVSPFSLPYPPGGGQGQALQLNTSDIARAGTAAKLELYKINLEGQRQFIMDQARDRIEQQKINQAGVQAGRDEEFRWRKLDADSADAEARRTQAEFSNTMARGAAERSERSLGLSEANTKEDNQRADRAMEQSIAIARFNAIQGLVAQGWTSANAEKEVDKQFPWAKPGMVSHTGGGSFETGPDGQQVWVNPRIVAQGAAQQLPAAGSRLAPPTAQAPSATPGGLPAPLTPVQIEGIRQNNLVAGRDATIRHYGGQAGAMAPPVPGVPNWTTDPKTGKLVLVPGQPLANIPIFERTPEQLNEQLARPPQATQPQARTLSAPPTQVLAPPAAVTPAAQARNANQGIQSASMAETLNARFAGIQGAQTMPQPPRIVAPGPTWPGKGLPLPQSPLGEGFRTLAHPYTPGVGLPSTTLPVPMPSQYQPLMVPGAGLVKDRAAAEQEAMKQEAARRESLAARGQAGLQANEENFKALQAKGPALGPYEQTIAGQAAADAQAANASLPGPSTPEAHKRRAEAIKNKLAGNPLDPWSRSKTQEFPDYMYDKHGNQIVSPDPGLWEGIKNAANAVGSALFDADSDDASNQAAMAGLSMPLLPPGYRPAPSAAGTPAAPPPVPPTPEEAAHTQWGLVPLKHRKPFEPTGTPAEQAAQRMALKKRIVTPLTEGALNIALVDIPELKGPVAKSKKQRLICQGATALMRKYLDMTEDEAIKRAAIANEVVPEDLSAMGKAETAANGSTKGSAANVPSSKLPK